MKAIKKTKSVRSYREAVQLAKKGYVVVAISYFVGNNECTYHLEKGSKWSELLARN